MSAVNLINENDDEREIASQAACALRESFITAAQSGAVLYVENDWTVPGLSETFLFKLGHLT